MLNQPMSSPMMKMMLGFLPEAGCSCAAPVLAIARSCPFAEPCAQHAPTAAFKEPTVTAVHIGARSARVATVEGGAVAAFSTPRTGDGPASTLRNTPNRLDAAA